MPNVELYDTTLRDGAQYEGISLSVDDKLAITKKLDDLGVHYVEGGWPGSNPKDEEFFQRAQHLTLARTTMAAFGSTRRAGKDVKTDTNLLSLLRSEAPVITLVGKSSEFQVSKILETSLSENLSMISDSITFLRKKNRRVFFDAEHFFDGYIENPEYALRSISEAANSGADYVILCDTNGGVLPNEISKIVQNIAGSIDVPLGIHTHNDSETAVAGALAAIEAGATQVQGTINGYGERCGNANLLSIIAALKLKKSIDCITDKQLKSLTEVSRYVSEITNMPTVAAQPYVGSSAFAHKGGLHAAAVSKIEGSYQHIPPDLIGNGKRVLVSELSGRSNIEYKIQELNIGLELAKEQLVTLVEKVKRQESNGFQYEGAEASFELLVKRLLPGYEAPFTLVDFTSMVEARRSDIIDQDISSQAMVKVQVGNKTMHTAADGNGPVNSLDNALRKALMQFYPDLENVKLIDYKVRVVDQGHDTGAVVRVLIESTDGAKTWNTVGASTNIIEASWLALADSFEYWLVRKARGS